MMKRFPIRQFGLVAVVWFSAMAPVASRAAQQASQATGANDNSQEQEDARGMRTREFLGLGRMPDAKIAAEGQKIFASACGFCHGTDARGASGPDLLRSAVVLDDNQGELIGQTVHQGRPAKGMPAFPSLTDEQVREIAEYLHLQIELAANRGTYKALNVVTGNAKAGEAYFNGAGKCNTCHSVSGDLAHIGPKTNPPDLQQEFLYPKKPAVTKVTVTLTGWYPAPGNAQASRRFLRFALRRGGQLPFHPLTEGRCGGSRGQTAFPSPDAG